MRKLIRLLVLAAVAILCASQVNAQTLSLNEQRTQDSLMLVQMTKAYTDRFENREYISPSKMYLKKQNVVLEQHFPYDAIVEMKRNMQTFKPTYILNYCDDSEMKLIFDKIVALDKGLVLNIYDSNSRGSKRLEVVYTADEFKTLCKIKEDQANRERNNGTTTGEQQQKSVGVKLFDLVDEMPKFGEYTYTEVDKRTGQIKQYTVSGSEGLNVYLAKNVRYPIVAEDNRIEGTVECSFVIDVDGLVKDVMVIRSDDPSLTREAQRVIKAMPRWIPGKQDGNVVPVRLTIPVEFRLSPQVSEVMFNYRYHQNDTTLYEVSETEQGTEKRYTVRMSVNRSDAQGSRISFLTIDDGKKNVGDFDPEDEDGISELISGIWETVVRSSDVIIDLDKDGQPLRVVNWLEIKNRLPERAECYIDRIIQQSDKQKRNKLQRLKNLFQDSSVRLMLSSLVSESSLMELYEDFIQTDLPHNICSVALETPEGLKGKILLDRTPDDNVYTIQYDLGKLFDKDELNAALSNADASTPIRELLGSLGDALLSSFAAIIECVDYRMKKNGTVYDCGLVKELRTSMTMKIKAGDVEESSKTIKLIRMTKKNW